MREFWLGSTEETAQIARRADHAAVAEHPRHGELARRRRQASNVIPGNRDRVDRHTARQRDGSAADRRSGRRAHPQAGLLRGGQAGRRRRFAARTRAWSGWIGHAPVSAPFARRWICRSPRRSSASSRACADRPSSCRTWAATCRSPNRAAARNAHDHRADRQSRQQPAQLRREPADPEPMGRHRADGGAPDDVIVASRGIRGPASASRDGRRCVASGFSRKNQPRDLPPEGGSHSCPLRRGRRSPCWPVMGRNDVERVMGRLKPAPTYRRPARVGAQMRYRTAHS